VVLELFELFVSQPILVRIIGKKAIYRSSAISPGT